MGEDSHQQAMDAMRGKLENLISGYGINEDDAEWLRSACEPKQATSESKSFTAWFKDFKPYSTDSKGPLLESDMRCCWEASRQEVAVTGLEAGIKLVPVPPTKGMLEAFDRGFRHQLHRRRHGIPKKGFQGSAEEAGLLAMLAVCPDAPMETGHGDPTVAHGEMAGALLVHLGFATSPSMEPGADERRDGLAKKLAGLMGKAQGGSSTPSEHDAEILVHDGVIVDVKRQKTDLAPGFHKVWIGQQAA